ncbi:MAG: hypothetical protein ACC653_14230 [Gammaproteobacteria bacterium]
MDKNNTALTLTKFHELLHIDINKPVKDFRGTRRFRQFRAPHKAAWAQTTIFLEQKLINVRVYLNFKKNSINNIEYNKLKFLACNGISRYWSHHIKVGDNKFMVRVNASHRPGNAIPVDLSIENDMNEYGRSMNPAALGIDASFIYNKGHFINQENADSDFMLVAAHEFGHSVLMYAGGLSLSWGHKGSTNVLTQSVNSSTPGYPRKGTIDLMKYYDSNKASTFFNRRVRDSIAMGIDIKRLIWGSNIKWLK